MAGFLEQLDLGIGTTLANFQSEGNFPIIIDLLNRSERLLNMLTAVAFRILAKITSSPVALVESSEQMRSSTWSSVHSNSSGKLDESSDQRLQISATVKPGTK